MQCHMILKPKKIYTSIKVMVACVENTPYPKCYTSQKSPVLRVNETVVQLFCECKETIRIWKHFKAWANGYMNLLGMNPENILLGIWQERSHDSVLKNHILLMFKCYIYLRLQKWPQHKWFESIYQVNRKY